MLVKPREDSYFNEGMFYPIKTIFRKGSLLNPNYPAATTMGNQIGDQVIDSIMKALAGPLPDPRHCGVAFHVRPKMDRIGWNCTGEQYFDFGFFAEKGGSGAVQGADGIDVIDDSKNGGDNRVAGY